MEGFPGPRHTSARPALQPLVDWLWRSLDASGLTRNSLSRRSGWNKTFVYELFDGSREPRRDQVLDVAAALGRPASELDDILLALGRTHSDSTYRDFIRTLNHQVALQRETDSIVGAADLVGREVEAPYVQRTLTIDSEPTTLIDHLRRHTRVVIQGSPGAGKSMAVRKLAAETARGTNSLQDHAVLVISLRDHLQSALSGSGGIVDLLIEASIRPYGVESSREMWHELSSRGLALFIFDGLDELGEVADRRRFVSLLEAFATRYPHAHMVVTSRTIGYDEAALNTTYFSHLDLQEFDSEQISEFASRWFQQISDQSNYTSAHSYEVAFNDATSAVRDLKSNPLLLSLLHSIFLRGHFGSQDAASVFDRCATLLFEDWDRIRGISVGKQFEPYLRKAMQDMSYEISRTMPAHQAMSRTRVLTILRDALQDGGMSPQTSLHWATDFLRFCAGRKSILAVAGEEDGRVQYGFAHRTFLEFFTASALLATSESAADLAHHIAVDSGDASWDFVHELTIQLCATHRIDWLREAMEILIVDREPVSSFEHRLTLAAAATAYTDESLLHLVVTKAFRHTRIYTEFAESTLPHAPDASAGEKAMEALWGTKDETRASLIAHDISNLIGQTSLDDVSQHFSRDLLGVPDQCPVARQVADLTDFGSPFGITSLLRTCRHSAAVVQAMFDTPAFGRRRLTCYAARVLRAINQNIPAVDPELVTVLPLLIETQLPIVTTILGDHYLAPNLDWVEFEWDRVLALTPPAKAAALLLALPFVDLDSKDYGQEWSRQFAGKLSTYLNSIASSQLPPAARAMLGEWLAGTPSHATVE